MSTPLESIPQNLGPIYLGVVVAVLLSGMISMQAFIYFRNYPQDWVVYRAAIGVLWALDTVHLGFMVQVGYHYLVESYDTPGELSAVSLPLKIQVTINIIILLFVQSLYTLRIWRLGRSIGSNIIPILVITAVAGGYAVGINMAISIYSITQFAQVPQISTDIYLSFTTSTIIDISIALAILYYMTPTFSSAPDFNHMLSKIVNYAIASGLVTGTCSLSTIVVYKLLPRTLVYIGLEFALTKLYIISFLAMLNARQQIQNHLTPGGQTTLVSSRYSIAQNSTRAVAKNIQLPQSSTDILALAPRDKPGRPARSDTLVSLNEDVQP